MWEQYDVYKEDPDAVEPEIKGWFDQYGPPSSNGESAVSYAPAVEDKDQAVGAGLNMEKIADAVKLAENIRIHGHLSADITPLQEPNGETSFLRIEEYGLSEEDLRTIPKEILCPDAPESVSDGLEAIEHLKQMYTKT